MLYFVAVLALTLLSGAHGQGTDADGVDCVGDAIPRSYDFCGSFGAGINVYWTYVEEDAQLNVLFESSDDGYTAFGFSESAAPMDGANVVLGCQDWGIDGLDGAFEIALPETGEDRTVANVAAGIGENQLAAAAVEQARENGLCGVRFERLAVLADVDVNGTITDVADGHDILVDIENLVIWARGPADGAAFHALGQGAASQDFIAGDGDITDSPLVDLVEATTTMATGVPTEDGSANIASLSSMLIGAVAALTAALW